MNSNADREDNPSEDEIWFSTALSKIEKGDIKGARDALIEAIGLQPEIADYHAELALVYERLGDISFWLYPGRAQP